MDRFQYAYDYDSNPLYKKNTLSAAHSELYHANGATNGYDGLNRLVSFSRGTLSDTNSDGIMDTVASPAQTLGYTLDTEGNWSSLNVNGTSTSRTHDAQNKLTAIGSSPLSYDAGGYQTVDENGHALSYDAWGHLMTFSASSTNTVSYTYDGMGRRIARIDKTGSTVNKASYFTYTANWQVATETSPQSSTTELDYVWSPVYVDAMIARDTYATKAQAEENRAGGGGGSTTDSRTDGGAGTNTIIYLPTGVYLSQRVYVRQDANWNVTSTAVGSMAINSGAVTVISGGTLSSERYEYQPYGTVTYLSTSFGTLSGSGISGGWVYLSQGGRQDEKSGLLAFRNRDRNTNQGRWVQPDFGRYIDGSNLYQYATSNPLAFGDPSGLASDPNMLLLDEGAYGIGTIRMLREYEEARLRRQKEIADWARREKADLGAQLGGLGRHLLGPGQQGPPQGTACGCTPEDVEKQGQAVADAIVDAVARHRLTNGDQYGGSFGNFGAAFGNYVCGDWRNLVNAAARDALNKIAASGKQVCLQIQWVDVGTAGHRWIEIGLANPPGGFPQLMNPGLTGPGETVPVDPWPTGGKGSLTDPSELGGRPGGVITPK